MKLAFRILKFLLLFPLALTFPLWGPFVFLAFPFVIVFLAITIATWNACK